VLPGQVSAPTLESRPADGDRNAELSNAKEIFCAVTVLCCNCGVSLRNKTVETLASNENKLLFNQNNCCRTRFWLLAFISDTRLNETDQPAGMHLSRDQPAGMHLSLDMGHAPLPPRRPRIRIPARRAGDT
jgi:hypothetical protein